ncbi:MAG: hypothetical protein F6K54_29850 [Okeania sp. SIO3B5]|uniref:hypothetical protein n=1 Tax=Okeania sp. SIO3B5 TaxID=2607811 RepID=UPI0013FE84DD|nr:hypothetical protein [Okeania sp. SIO3B5]NEO56908.1 hypothetical protein [Okeania sp. SIO3B5]
MPYIVNQKPPKKKSNPQFNLHISTEVKDSRDADFVAQITLLKNVWEYQTERGGIENKHGNLDFGFDFSSKDYITAVEMVMNIIETLDYSGVEFDKRCGQLDRELVADRLQELASRVMTIDYMDEEEMEENSIHSISYSGGEK